MLTKMSTDSRMNGRFLSPRVSESSLCPGDLYVSPIPVCSSLGLSLCSTALSKLNQRRPRHQDRQVGLKTAAAGRQLVGPTALESKGSFP